MSKTRVTRRKFIVNVGLGVAGLAMEGCHPSLDTRESKLKDRRRDAPNVLFLITDEQSFNTLGVAGNMVLRTPNLDRLAMDGAYFENAYSYFPVCVPARSVILTGQSTGTLGVLDNGDVLREDPMPVSTFDNVLSKSKYWTEYHGRWHCRLDPSRTYENVLTPALKEDVVELLAKNWGPIKTLRDSYREHLDKFVPRRTVSSGELLEIRSLRPYRPDPVDRRYGISPSEWPRTPTGELNIRQSDEFGCLLIPIEHTETAVIAKKTMTALERVKDRPFSITCSFQHPHPPMVVPRPYYGMYPFEQLEPPISIKDSMHNSPYRELASRMKRFRNKDYVRQMTSNYYGLISEIDYWIGQILEKLKSLNLEENTLVVFTSDHGDMLGAHGMISKLVFYEESVHVPLIMRLPGVIPAETVVSKPVSHIDLFPTILDYVGIVGHASEGRSLRSLIEKTGSDGLDYCCSECFNVLQRNTPTLMVRTNRWKFLFAHSARSLTINALYNLEEDPHEMNNLIGKNPNKSAFVRKAEEMKARLVEWLEHIESAHIEGVKARSV